MLFYTDASRPNIFGCDPSNLSESDQILINDLKDQVKPGGQKLLGENSFSLITVVRRLIQYWSTLLITVLENQ